MAALYAFLRKDGLQAAPGKEVKADSSPPPETAAAVREPIHSGQCVEIEESFIVPGELHPGVGIQAGRDVIVMGSARGRGLVSGSEDQSSSFCGPPSCGGGSCRPRPVRRIFPAAGDRTHTGWQMVGGPFTGWVRAKARPKVEGWTGWLVESS